MWLRRTALTAARTRPGSWLLRRVWKRIPIEKLTPIIYESQHWKAVQHPQPEYALHILLLPVQPYRNLQELQVTSKEVLSDLLAVVNVLIERYDLQTAGYRLITNGGIYQDVALLHFHLVSENAHEQVEG